MKIIVVGTNNCWGRADNITQAMKNAYNPKHYAVWLCSDETKVNDIDGGLVYPLKNGEPILLDKKLPKTAKPKPEEREKEAPEYDESIVITMVDTIEDSIKKWQSGIEPGEGPQKTDGVLMEAVGEAIGNARLELSRMQRQKEAS